MYQRYKRHLRAIERKILQDRIREGNDHALHWRNAKWLIVWITYLSACLMAAYACLLSSLPMILKWALAGVFVFFLVFGVYAILVVAASGLRERRYKIMARKRVALFRTALVSNEVVVKRIQSSSVVVIEPFGDEAIAYLFDIGEGQIFFLQGDEYFPAEDSMPWPSDDFELVRTQCSDLWIGLFCLGGKLEREHVVRDRACKEEVLRECHEEVICAAAEEYLGRITHPIRREDPL